MGDVQRTNTARASFENKYRTALKRAERVWRLSAFLLAVIPVTLEAGQFGDFTYTTSYFSCTITGYSGAGGDVEIPDYVVEGTTSYGVVGIGDRAFEACENLTGIRIPSGVSSIGSGAFYGCFRLARVIIPARVSSVRSDTFKACSNLTSVTVSALKVASIESGAFSDCTRLSAVYFLGDKPYSADPSIFGDSASATIFYQPQKHGWESTFAGQPTVELPYKYVVTVDGQASFCGFGSLVDGDVSVPAETGGYPVTGIGGQAFVGCSGITHVTIPTHITSIGVGAFSGCVGLTQVAIPDSVTNIDNYAFADCECLRSVTIGESAVNIGAGAFSGCRALTGVSIAASVDCIGDQAFESCSGLRTIPELGGVTRIGSGAFSDCSGLSGVLVPGGVTNVGWWAFSDCLGLTSVAIPGSVAFIGDYAFSGCDALNAINVSGDNANYSSLDGILFNSDQTVLIKCPSGKTGDYAMPLSVNVVKNEAFLGCSSLSSVTIPASVSNIGGYTFEGCAGLTAINVNASNAHYCSLDGVLFDNLVSTLIQYPIGKPQTSYAIPSNVNRIADCAFEGCAGLTDVAIPPSVTSIGDCAFKGCAGLTEITIPANVNNIGYQAFLDCVALAAINVDSANVVYSSVDGVLLDNDNWWRTLIQCPAGKTGTFAIPDGVRTIGEGAFFNCAGLTGVTVPSTVYDIRDYAFFNCTGLTSIAIPDSCVYIGNLAFLNCLALTAIDVDANNARFCSVAGVLFNKSQTTLIQCPAGKAGSYCVPSSVTRLEDYAFFNCFLLTDVALPASVETVGECAFSNCRSLMGITADEGNPNYSSQNGVLFSKDMSCLIQYPAGKTESSYTVSNSVTCIADGAFSGAESLRGVYFKGDVPCSIGLDVFAGTDHVTVYYLRGAVGWGQPVDGHTAVLWDPYVQAGSGFGRNEAGQFGFTVLGTNDMSVVVEACTNLVSAVWTPISTVTLSHGVGDFNDAASTNHPARYYRFRMP